MFHYSVTLVTSLLGVDIQLRLLCPTKIDVKFKTLQKFAIVKSVFDFFMLLEIIIITT